MLQAMAYKHAWVLKKTNEATWRCERLSYRPWVAVEIVVKMMGIPAFQRSSCWSSASVSSSSLLLLPPPLPTVQSSSSSPSSCSWWHKNRPPVNCCTVKLATKFLSSPVIDFQYYYKRKEASIAVVRAVASPSSPSSPMPAQQAVEEEEEKSASNW
jgi:hypothetical protein